MSSGETIRALRVRKAITQEELAEAVGVNVTTVSAWERDVAQPRLRMRRTLARVLGVSVDELGFSG